ncbi:MAG TPA: PilZ domain-containing protein [bacterium]|nr:PilZ domain-containing protein [bacterium]
MAEEIRAIVAKTKDEPAHKGEHLPDGRYIPYSGGCMSWYENSGIPKSELPNRYLFSTAMDATIVRSKRFERSGTVQDKRTAVRVPTKTDVSVTLIWGENTKSATTKDVSSQGMRVQFLDEVVIKHGDAVKVQAFDNSGAVALEMDATVMWTEKSGKIRAIWNVGVGFARLGPEQEKQLKALMGVRET